MAQARPKPKPDSIYDARLRRAAGLAITAARLALADVSQAAVAVALGHSRYAEVRLETGQIMTRTRYLTVLAWLADRLDTQARTAAGYGGWRLAKALAAHAAAAREMATRLSTYAPPTTILEVPDDPAYADPPLRRDDDAPAEFVSADAVRDDPGTC